jgi:hypothetical protein
MADDILRAKIALDGGTDIAKQLAEIGKAGDQAFKQISDAARQSTGGLNAFRSAADSFGPLGSGLGSIVKGIGEIAAAFSALSGIMAAVGAKAAKTTNDLVDTAKELKTTTEEVQRLQFAAGAAGISGDKLNSWLDKTKNALDETAKSAKNHFRAIGELGSESAAFFASNGISVISGAKPGEAGKTSLRFEGLFGLGAREDANNFQAVLLKIGETLKGLDDGPRKDSFIAALKTRYGKHAEEIEDLAVKISTTKEIFNKLGLAETDHAKEVSKEWGDSFHRLSLNLSEQKTVISATISGTLHEIGLLFTPFATSSQDGLSEFIEKHRLDLPNFVSNYIKPAINSIRDFFAAHDFSSFGGFKQAASDIFGGIVTRASAAWAQISQAVSKIDFSALWTSIEAQAVSVFSRLGEIAKNGYDALKSTLVSAFPSLAAPLAEIEKIASAVFDKIKGFSRETWIEIGIGLLASAALWGGGFSALAIAAAVAWRAVWAGAVETVPILGTAWRSISVAGSGAFAEIMTAGRAFLAWFGSLFSGNSAVQAQAWRQFATAASEAWATVRTAFAEGYAWLRAQSVSSIPWLRGPWEALEGAVSGAWAWIKAEHQKGWTVIKGVWDDLLAVWKAVEGGANFVAKAINGIFGTSLTGKQLLLIGAFLQFTGILAPVLALVTALAVVFDGLALAITAAVLIMEHPAIAAFLAGLIGIKLKTGELSETLGNVKTAIGDAFGGAGASSGVFTTSIAKLVLGVRSLFSGTGDAANETKKDSDGFFSGIISGFSKLFSGNQDAADHFRKVQKDSLEGVKKDHEDTLGILGKLWKEFGVSSASAAEAKGGVPGGKPGAKADLAGSYQEAVRIGSDLASIMSRIAGDIVEPFKSMEQQTKQASDGFFANILKMFSGGGEGHFGGRNFKNAPKGDDADGEASNASDHSLTAHGNSVYLSAEALQRSAEANTEYLGSVEAASEKTTEAKSSFEQAGEATATASGLLQTFTTGIRNLSDAMSNFKLPGGQSAAPVDGHAAGGHISGPGTGTSDSILARLSNGEFVVNAKAVAAWGPGFFHALNNFEMPRFALGGMIGAPSIASIPAFASGGQVSGRGGLISFPLGVGGQHFEMFASRDTIRDLERHSSSSQMSSTTRRKPSWDR